MPARFLRSSSVCARRCTPSPAVSGDAAPVRQHLGDVGLSAGKLAARMAAHPAVQIETEERTSADIVSCITAGVAQAGVVSDAVDPGPLRLDPVADDPLVLIVPPAHPLAENRKWRLRRCSTSRWSPSIRPVRYSSISNSTQLNSAGAKRSGQDEPSCRALRDGGARRRRGDPAARYCRALPAALFVCRHRVTGPLGAAPFVPVLP